MKVSTNKTSTDPGKKSDRHHKNEADKKKQEANEGKDTPFQNAMRDAEGRNKKVFHWHDKDKKASDTPFKGSRPIATKSTTTEGREIGKSKVGNFGKDAEVKKEVPKVKVNPPGVKVKKVYDQDDKGKRSHGVVKNNILRKIDAVIQPGKYGAVSNSGKSVNINKGTAHKSDKPDVKGYEIDLGKDKKMTVKKLKPKAILKEAKSKGYIN